MLKGVCCQADDAINPAPGSMAENEWQRVQASTNSINVREDSRFWCFTAEIQDESLTKFIY